MHEIFMLWSETKPSLRASSFHSFFFFLLKFHLVTARLANSLLWTHLSKTFHQSNKVTYWKSSIKDIVLSYRAGAKSTGNDALFPTTKLQIVRRKFSYYFYRFGVFFMCVWRQLHQEKNTYQKTPLKPTKPPP